MIVIAAVTYNGTPAPAEMRGEFGPQGGTLGRGTDNLLSLPDPARHVSRVQGRVRWDGERYWIANVSDANPLFLNDEEVESRKEAPLSPGDELRVGLYVLSVRDPADHLADTRSMLAMPPARVTTPPARGTTPPGAKGTTGALPGDSMEALLGGAGVRADSPFSDLLGGSPPIDLPPAASPASAAGASLFDPIPSRGQPDPIAPPSRTSAMPSNVDPLAGMAQPFDPLAPSAGLPSGDPFADLLAPSGNGAPLAPSARRDPPGAFAGGTIPADFDPFADPGAGAKHNSDDPLRDLAAGGISLGEVNRETPKSLVDFDVARNADPQFALHAGTPSLVDPLQAVDPMQLFGGPDDRLVVSRALASTAPPMRDDSPELGAFFAPARAIEDPSLPVRPPSALPADPP
ncbi:MAG: FHA domain-containing protein, partial [Betaproteobacteria bacterium]